MKPSLAALKKSAARCRACPLYRHATQTVFGEGSPRARLFLVGEQPGDKEDVAGRPFVGPAGMLLDRALADAGIGRGAAYVTNAVKHFKFEERGRRRIHQKPAAGEVAACRRWLEGELQAVRPDVLVCLGATATRDVLGPSVKVLKDRGKLRPSEFCAATMVTVHPSALLRVADRREREENYRAFVRDLRVAARALKA